MRTTTDAKPEVGQDSSTKQAPPTLQQVADQISIDIQENPRQYLADTEVPHGGE